MLCFIVYTCMCIHHCAHNTIRMWHQVFCLFPELPSMWYSSTLDPLWNGYCQFVVSALMCILYALYVVAASNTATHYCITEACWAAGDRDIHALCIRKEHTVWLILLMRSTQKTMFVRCWQNLHVGSSFTWCWLLIWTLFLSTAVQWALICHVYGALQWLQNLVSCSASLLHFLHAYLLDNPGVIWFVPHCCWSGLWKFHIIGI